MRRLFACALALGVVLAGCGGGGSEHPARATRDAGWEGPVPAAGTPQPLDYVGGSRAALKSGAIAVVDLSNRVGVEPALMDVNSEQRLTALRWSGWGSREAAGRGEEPTPIFDPNRPRGA